MATRPSVQLPRFLAAWARFVEIVNRDLPSYAARTSSATTVIRGGTGRRGGV